MVTLYRSFDWKDSDLIPCSLIRESYEHFVHKKNSPRWNTVAKQMKSIWPELKHSRKRVVSGHAYYYLLPGIDDVRAAFEAHVGITFDRLPEECEQDEVLPFAPTKSFKHMLALSYVH